MTARCITLPASVSASARCLRLNRDTPSPSQLLNLATDGGLRQKQFLRSVREAERSRRDLEGAQQLKARQIGTCKAQSSRNTGCSHNASGHSQNACKVFLFTVCAWANRKYSYSWRMLSACSG